MRSAAWTVSTLLCPFAAIALYAALPAAEPNIDDGFFRAKIAPLLQQSCLDCHNSKKSRGGLDLSSRAQLLVGGDKGPAIAPGQADKSLLIEMVSGAKPAMPRQKPPLNAAQVADLKSWINTGAPWPKDVALGPQAGESNREPWWSLRPLTRPQLPAVKNKAWPRTPIDTFILAKMEEVGLEPSPEVDRVTFLRRAKYDLHGLPPTPAESAAFVNDTAANAFERLIDRLLASAHYGERWGRHWLDIAHYADTHGYDKDKRRLWAWLYRDWVISALNEGMPYERFVRMQVAGDVLEPNTAEGVIATGFVVAGPWDFVGHVELREGTVDKEKTRVLDRDDMVSNTIACFNSLTIHCARCHEHKFDPISQKEYYQLQAVFAGVERGDRGITPPDARARITAVEQQAQRLRLARAALEQKVKAVQSPELTQLERELALLRQQLPAAPLLPPSPTNGYHSGIAATPEVEKWVQMDLGRRVPLDEIRIFPARPTDFPDAPGFGFPKRFRVEISDEPSFQRTVSIADYRDRDFANPGDVAWSVHLEKQHARHVRFTAYHLWERTKDYVFALAELQVFSEGKNIAQGATVTAKDTIEAGRWSTRHLVDGHTSRQRLPAPTDPHYTAWEQRRQQQRKLWQLQRRQEELSARLVDPALRRELVQIEAALAKLAQERTQVAADSKAYAVLPIAPRPIHLLHRGDVERKGEAVAPMALSLMPVLKPELAIADSKHEGQRRLALANWLVDANNVLTWRSIVNRVWQYHLGRGLVDTPNDFGKNGAPPTHPQLLDWLALDFRDNGQSLKKLHKQIMLSAAYRQTVRHDEAAAKIDSDNRYLWRMNRQRLEAEAIRDSVLAVSGKLDPRMGGPGFELFRFKDDHSPIYDHSALDKINDPQTYRRTIYRFTVRSVPNPFLDNLDCADPNLSVPVRNKTLTALQALSLLNNPFMLKQADYFAERLQKHSSEPERQAEQAVQLAFGRQATAAEVAALAQHARQHGLARMCRVLFNANEFLFVD